MPTGTKISVNHEKIKTGFQSFFAESNKAITTCANNTDISSKFERISNFLVITLFLFTVVFFFFFKISERSVY